MDFKTHSGKRVGLAMRKKSEGAAEIMVCFESGVPDDTKVTFIKCVHEHLMARAQPRKKVTRVRTYVCPNCDEPLENRLAVQKRLAKGLKDIICPMCERRVPLLDLIEEKFASNEFLQKVRKMDELAGINLDNESLELILVGHAIAIAAESGQIFRPVTWADWGIDGEIEFKDIEGKASGQRLYLQLKSGDSYLYFPFLTPPLKLPIIHHRIVLEVDDHGFLAPNAAWREISIHAKTRKTRRGLDLAFRTVPASHLRYPMLMRPDTLSFSKMLPFLELPIITPAGEEYGPTAGSCSGRGLPSSIANSRSLFSPGGKTGGGSHQADELNSLFLSSISLA